RRRSRQRPVGESERSCCRPFVASRRHRGRRTGFDYVGRALGDVSRNVEPTSTSLIADSALLEPLIEPGRQFLETLPLERLFQHGREGHSPLGVIQLQQCSLRHLALSERCADRGDDEIPDDDEYFDALPFYRLLRSLVIKVPSRSMSGDALRRGTGDDGAVASHDVSGGRTDRRGLCATSPKQLETPVSLTRISRYQVLGK